MVFLRFPVCSNFVNSINIPRAATFVHPRRRTRLICRTVLWRVAVCYWLRSEAASISNSAGPNTERERQREKSGKRRMFGRGGGGGGSTKETECVGYIAKNWILVERMMGGGKSIPAYDSNLFFNFEACILQILKFPKNLYVSRFLFSDSAISFISTHPLRHRRNFFRHSTHCYYEPRQFGRNNGCTTELIIRGSNPGRGDVFFSLHQIFQIWGLPTLIFSRYCSSFLVEKRPGRYIDQSLPSSAEDKKRVQPHLQPRFKSSCSAEGQFCSTSMYWW